MTNDRKSKAITRWVTTGGYNICSDVVDDNFFKYPDVRHAGNTPDDFFPGFRLVNVKQHVEIDHESREVIGMHYKTFVYECLFDESLNEKPSDKKQYVISSKEDLLKIIGNPEEYAQQQ